MAHYILAHDLGTSGNKATLYDEQGRLRGSCTISYSTLYPCPGGVEQDPDSWWGAVCRATQQLLTESAVRAEEILCVCFSAQMMGCLLVDRQGIPLHRALIWADTRSQEEEKELLCRVGQEEGYRITGHRLSASYSAAKLLWLRKNAPDSYKKAYKVLQAKDYMVYRLTGEFHTDYSDASGTNLLDISHKCWSKSILKEMEIDGGLLPELLKSTDVVGGVTASAASATGLMEGTPVVMGGGDGSCACVGAGVTEPGKAYTVIGTSSWISFASTEPFFDPEMRTFNWVHLDDKLYAPCGTMQAAGYSYSWFRDIFCHEEVVAAKGKGVSPYSLMDELAAQSVPGAHALLFLPYLLGERSPWWDSFAKGTFIGLSATTTRADFSRAVLEGVGYNLRVILDILQTVEPLEKIAMIGGGAKSDFWLQLLANIWQKPLEVPQYIEEATSMGAAICGGVGVGLFPDFRVADMFNQIRKTILPDASLAKEYERMYQVFNMAYQQLAPVFRRLA